jgi:hypothetical protein
VLSGCGNSIDTRPALGTLVPVQGRILMGGKPLSEGTVVFVAVDPRAAAWTPAGAIQADGTYTLATDGRPGAPVGKYRVMIKPGKGSIKAMLQVNRKYTNNRSPLQVEVAENKAPGDYDFNLEPPPVQP